MGRHKAPYVVPYNPSKIFHWEYFLYFGGWLAYFMFCYGLHLTRIINFYEGGPICMIQYNARSEVRPSHFNFLPKTSGHFHLWLPRLHLLYHGKGLGGSVDSSASIGLANKAFCRFISRLHFTRSTICCGTRRHNNILLPIIPFVFLLF